MKDKRFVPSLSISPTVRKNIKFCKTNKPGGHRVFKPRCFQNIFDFNERFDETV